MAGAQALHVLGQSQTTAAWSWKAEVSQQSLFGIERLGKPPLEIEFFPIRD